MIDSDTMKRLEQARGLIAEVNEDLKRYLETIPATHWADPRLFERREQVMEQQTAIKAVNSAETAVNTASLCVSLIWERLGKPEPAAPAPTVMETVRVGVNIEPRWADAYSEVHEVDIPAGLTGQERESAIFNVVEDIVNNDCPWGFEEVPGDDDDG